MQFNLIFFNYYLVVASDAGYFHLLSKAGAITRFKHSDSQNMSSLTSWLLQFFAAEFGCGGCCWVMGRGTIGEHEVAVMKDLANTLLRCFSHLQHMDYHHSETSNNQSVTLQWEFKNSVSIVFYYNY